MRLARGFASRKVAGAVVEQDDHAARVPWGHVVERGVFDNVEVAVAVHVVDLACRPKRAVQQVARSVSPFVGEVANSSLIKRKSLAVPPPLLTR